MYRERSSAHLSAAKPVESQGERQRDKGRKREEGEGGEGGAVGDLLVTSAVKVQLVEAERESERQCEREFRV
jgi:hypothetical protein